MRYIVISVSRIICCTSNLWKIRSAFNILLITKKSVIIGNREIKYEITSKNDREVCDIC